MALTWERVDFSLARVGNIAYGNGKWVILTDQLDIYTEIAPGNWEKTYTSGYTSRGESPMRFLNGHFIVADRRTSGEKPFVICSEDGINWEKRNLPGASSCIVFDIAYGNGVYVVCCSSGSGGYVYPSFMTSPDLVKWTNNTLETASENMKYAQIITCGDKFVAAAFENSFPVRIYTSYDGFNWSATTGKGIPQAKYGTLRATMLYKDGYYYMSTTAGVIVKSSDGINWSTVLSPSPPIECAHGCSRNDKLLFTGNDHHSVQTTFFRPWAISTVDGLNFQMDRIFYAVSQPPVDYGDGEYRAGYNFYYFRAYDPEKPLIINLQPSKGFVDEKGSNRFSWTIGGYESKKPQDQRSAVLEWRVPNGDGSVMRLTVDGPDQYMDIPAGTFPNGAVEWRVSAVAGSGLETGWTGWMALTTVDSVPGAPLFLAPDGRNVDGTVPVTFSWQHNIGTGSTQSRYDAEYSLDGNAWEPLSSEETSRDNFVVPAGTFLSGPLHWRVRTYSTDGDPGPWAAASVTVQSAPAPPVLNVSGSNPRPVVSWQTPEQISYQICAGSFDSGEQYGTARQYKIPVYLPDGETKFSVRVCNQYGLWSGWSETTVVIANRPGDAVKLSARSRAGGVVLMWSGSYPKYYVYRDGALIGKSSARTFTDWLSAGMHRYQVRGVTPEDYYGMSNERSEKPTVAGAAIAAIGVYDWIPLPFRAESPPVHDGSIAPDVVYRRYSGKPLPVAEVYDYSERPHTVSFSVESAADFERIAALAHKDVVYKDCHDALILGVLDEITFSGSRGVIDFDLSIREIYREAARYD